MLLIEYKILLRMITIALSVVVFCFLSGCVSASLDDIGLENTSLSAPAAQTALPLETNIAGITEPTQLNAAVNSVGGDQPTKSVISLREDDFSSVPASNAIVDFEAGTAPNRISGLAEIRAKAAATGGDAPNINEIPSTRGRHFTADELRLKRALLRAEAQAAQGLITETELTQKRAQIAAMRRKARSHYDQAVRQISK